MAKTWYLRKGENTHGPFTSAQLKQLANQGKIKDSMRVANDESGPWQPVSDIQGLRIGATVPARVAKTEVQKHPSPAPAVIDPIQPMRVAPVDVRVPCPICGEEIAETALKCRHCNEFLDGRPREQPQVVQQAVAAPMPAPTVNVHMSQVTNVNMRRRWSAVIAMLLSLFIPGLGQLYKGQPINGMVWFVLTIGGYFALIIPGVVLHVLCILGAGLGDPYR